MKKSHLTPNDRTRIEILLSEGCSIRYIADRLDKAPSTISREINKHICFVQPRTCDCIYFRDCPHSHVCGTSSCRKSCRTCQKAKKYCADYVQAECDHLLKTPTHVCNACPKKNRCHYERRIYDAGKAQAQYRASLVNTRLGLDLTAKELQQIDALVSPLVHKGQSIYHIVQSHQEEPSISESTLRRLISSSELDVRNIDLPEKVRRKPGRKKKEPSTPPISKTEHLYSDYLAFIQTRDYPVVQMDCVEGTKEDTAVLLTLHFPAFHMQLVYVLKKQTAPCVVDMLDAIETSLGKELFTACSPLFLPIMDMNLRT